MKKKNIILVYGGGGSEHDISLISAAHIRNLLKNRPELNLISIEISKDLKWLIDGQKLCQLNFDGELITDGSKTPIDFAIPALHGFPGETGDIQSFFELINLPYLGCNSEASKICFNKLTSKLWFSALGIANTPYVFLTEDRVTDEIREFFITHKKVVVKATNQGSSVGCYLAETLEDLKKNISEAFNFSEFVIIEKFINARELEISTYEINGELIITNPGEISCPSKFYSFDEKYSSNSATKTATIAEDVSAEIIQQMKKMAATAFKGIKLRHLSRMDFFLTDDNQILLNEINTFPGLTPISMFPKMMEAHGDKFLDFLLKNIK